MTINAAIKLLEKHGYKVYPQDRVKVIGVDRSIPDMDIFAAKEHGFDVKQAAREYISEMLAVKLLHSGAISWLEFKDATIQSTVVRGRLKVVV